MSRLQLALNVDDLEEAVAFYSQLFGSEPAKRRPGYANFAVERAAAQARTHREPGPGRALNHLGVELADVDGVDPEQGRLTARGSLPSTSAGPMCCYAKQDKFWVQGPRTASGGRSTRCSPTARRSPARTPAASAAARSSRRTPRLVRASPPAAEAVRQPGAPCPGRSVTCAQHAVSTLCTWRRCSTTRSCFGNYAVGAAWDEMFRPRASPGRRTTRCSPPCSRSVRPSCGSAPTSWPGSSPTAASPSRTRARSGRSRSTSSRGSSPPPSGTASRAGVEQRVQRAGGVPGRRLRPGRGVRRRGGAAPADHHQRALPPRGGRHRAGQRRTRARRRRRPDPRRAGPFRVLEDNLRIPSGV